MQSTTFRVMRTSDNSGTFFGAYTHRSTLIANDQDVGHLATKLYFLLACRKDLRNGENLCFTQFSFEPYCYDLYFPHIIHQPLSSEEIQCFCTIMRDEYNTGKEQGRL